MKKILADRRVLPVLTIPKLHDAVPAAVALQAGGVDIVEVTLRTPIALDVIQLLKEQFPKMIIGAGTVINLKQLKEVKAAGAEFAVSPGFSSEIAKAALEQEFPYLPGVATPGEIIQAKEIGYSFIKLFPTAFLGGINFVKTMGTVFTDIKFCISGGVGHAEYRNYLALDNVDCVSGTWLASVDLIQSKKWAEITKFARDAVS